MKRSLVLALAGLGFALSIALEVLHVRAYLLPSSTSFCSVGETLDCTSVALSRHSVLFGVPVAIWGALGFVAIGIAAFLRSRWLLPLTAAAAFGSLVLLGVELFSVGSVCLLCELVHIDCFALFALAVHGRRDLSGAFGNRDDMFVMFGPPLGIAIAAFLFVPRYWGAFSWKGEVPFAHGKTAEGFPWIGAENPTLVVSEFTDYGCPHCKAASARNLRRLASHPNTFRIVRRQYPRSSCPKTVKGICPLVRAAYCADEQGKFWQADRFLFEFGITRPRPSFATMAAELGLDRAKFETCSERNDIYERAENESRLALKSKVAGTPTFLVGDKRVSEETLNTLLSHR